MKILNPYNNEKAQKNRTRDDDHGYLPRKKKAFGQHFLRKQSVVDHMIEAVSVTKDTSVLEIGCGDGFLTRSILASTPCKRLQVFEIDPEWADYVRGTIRDSRLKVTLANVLEIDFEAELGAHKPWVLLANLPYQITFPILFLIQKNKHLFTEGVVMVQEEVAHKIVAQRGKGYNPSTLFLQHHFEWKMMERIEPGAFVPPPKINSRLLYFKPKMDVKPIPDEEQFWAILKLCFRSPRQTLRNNLKTTHLPIDRLSPEQLGLRAQQMSFDGFLALWQQLVAK